MADAVIAVLTREHVKVITFATQTTHIFQVLDLVLFGALNKRATRLNTIDEEQPPLHSSSGSITTSDRQWWGLTFGALFLPSASAMTSSKSQMNYSSMSKSSDKVEASSNSGSATCIRESAEVKAKSKI
jgi:hypothetical protein